jgi:hypothetical protein
MDLTFASVWRRVLQANVESKTAAVGAAPLSVFNMLSQSEFVVRRLPAEGRGDRFHTLMNITLRSPLARLPIASHV